MEKEISSGTMLGIVLIALAAVIGLGFGVFAIAKGVANEGVVNVQDNLGAVSESAFTDFDQKIVTGTQVMSAYKQFQGKAVAILINTQAMTKGVSSYKEHENIYMFEIGVKNYVNYNAILSPDAEGNLPDAAKGGDALDETGSSGLNLKDGIVSTENGFSIDTNGKVIFDTAIGGFTKAGNSEYISSSAKFDANLIKDLSGQIVGVAFSQLAQ